MTDQFRRGGADESRKSTEAAQMKVHLFNLRRLDALCSSICDASAVGHGVE